MKKKIIAVGMSGGVDSSVAALLLKEQGYDVFGLFMKNWEENPLLHVGCRAAIDFEDVAKVCHRLEIPFYPLNFSKEYYKKVFSYLVEGYQKGMTPNPDIICNREIKFDLFLKKAKELGADYIATGHYAQIEQKKGNFYLLKGRDSNKDQSYFLYPLKNNTLSNILFPIGKLTKSHVRLIAKKNRLATHAKRNSTGICFIGKRDFRQFLSQYLTPKKGPIITTEGKVIGEHEGAFFYTIGQRKGIGIGGQGEAWFVTGKEIKSNTLIVAQGKDHPSLFYEALITKECSWIANAPPSFPLVCHAKIRYRQEDQKCKVFQKDQYSLVVHFENPQRAVAPYQSIVFYKKNICLGGAIIEKGIHSLSEESSLYNCAFR